MNYLQHMQLLFYISVLIPLIVHAQHEVTHQADYKEITFVTSDGITVYGDLYTKNKNLSTILLFHQGGANARGEYGTIIPKLLNEGYNILAIDQRVGGFSYYGSSNRTIDNLSTNDYTYCDAYPDLEAALDYLIANEYNGKHILWGSSFGAALAIQLASKRQKDINALLAFSPSTGNAVKACHPNQYLKDINIPLLLLRPKKEMERESSVEQFDLAKKYNHQTYIAEYGVHGSSMLVEERVENNVVENWEVVLTFLKKYR